MPTKPQTTSGTQLSAFNALGSYADTIKDADGNVIKPSASTTTLSGNATRPSSSSSSKTAINMPHTKSREQKTAPVAKPAPAAQTEEEGAWETVQSTRQRPRQEEKEKHGSNSKNWRDRSHREGQGQKERNGDDSEKKGGGGKHHKKNTNSHAPPASASETTARPALPISTAVPTKPAWGALAHPTSAATAPAPSSVSAAPASKEANRQDSSVPYSPSLNGTTATANSVSVPASIGSPNLSSETASTSTASASVLSKAVDKLEEQGSWRARPKSKGDFEEASTIASAAAAPETPTSAPAFPEPQPAPRQAAPPPAVNAWDLRKKTMPPAASSTSNGTAAHAKPTISSSQAGQNGSPGSHKPITNGHAKDEGNKSATKKKPSHRVSGPGAVPPPIHDATLWPDVAQAAVVAKAEGKKDKPKEKGNAGPLATTEEATGTGKKSKWTPIPASEILANADHSHEQSRRQSRLDASAKKRSASTKGEGELSSVAGPKGGKPRKGSTHVVDPKKQSTRVGQNGSGSEVKPPQPLSNQQGPQAEIAINGNVEGAVADEGHIGEQSNGNVPTPLSRQTSRQSKAGSPSKTQNQLPSPASGDAAQVRLGSGPLQSRPMSGSNTAPLPQQTFNPATNNNTLPRPPRRDARGSFNGRGRGGFRGNSAMPHKGPTFGSPPLGLTGLPAEGSAFSRSFANFQPFYPVTGFAQQGIYDPMQAQYGAAYRSGPPPPPMPQTVVPNLDATRFYVLGQIEYYFSMQNLAMDFFLRQQMDSEGWIDVAMIASFNRLKSLTPDVSIVRECMGLSSFLEVREEKVRLSGTDASRWVLPDAKPSPFGPDHLRSPSQATEESRDLSLGIPASVEQAYTSGEDGQPIQLQTPRSFVAADVENALMKSSNTTNAAAAPVPPSSATSVNNGDGTEKAETATPATSASGDAVGKEEMEEVEPIEA